MHSYGAYVVLLREEFGWSAAAVAGAFSLTRIESGLLGPLQGWLTDHYGPRKVLVCGNLIFGFGFILLSLVDSLLSFYAVFVLIAVGGSLGGFATAMVSIVHWFDKNRSKAVAGSQLGFSLGGLAVPILTLILTWLGWRMTAVLSGIFILVVATPLSLLLRHSPSEIGEVPDGIQHPRRTSQDPNLPRLPQFTTMQALRTGAFWYLALGHAIALLTVSATMVHLLDHITSSLSYSLRQASLFLPLMFISQMVGQLTGGILGDRFDKRLLCTFCLISHAGAMFIIAFATNSWMVIAFSLLHGFAWGVRAPLLVSLRADYFGAQIFGKVLGFSSLITMLGMTVGPIIVGFIVDIFSEYWIGFSVIGIFALVGSGFFYLATPPPSPTPRKLDTPPNVERV